VTARAFSTAAVVAAQAAGERAYHEFLRVPALSAGLYVLEAGADDPQSPHRSDEVYVVSEGRGVLVVDGVEHPVEPGSIVYVPAGVRHRFERIAETLRVLVVFAPAEPPRAAGPPA
jgi:mannose-6-phosphate isomerase-like protein (cupin superfamily)